MKYWRLMIALIPVFVLVTCREEDKRGNIQRSDLYFDYKIWGEEDKEEVTVMLQFRLRGPEGTTIALEAPRTIQLDGDVLNMDSTRITGAYYEIQKLAASFAGIHTITFTDITKKQYLDTFRFLPFTLTTATGDSLVRDDIQLGITGLQDLAVVHVVLTDTSFTTNDISQIDTVRNGALLITRQSLKSVASGPVTLQLFKREEHPVTGGRKGGHISVTYGLQREFELKD